MRRGKSFWIEWRAEDTPERLHQAYQAEQDTSARLRLHALWLLRTERRLGEVATLLGVHYRTVRKWVAWYRAGGVAAVTAPRPGGRGKPAFLSPEQQATLVEQVAAGRFRTTAEIRDWIAGKYGVEYKRSGLYTLLGRLCCRPKVPRRLYIKPDLVAQEGGERQA